MALVSYILRTDVGNYAVCNKMTKLIVSDCRFIVAVVLEFIIPFFGTHGES